MSGNTGVEATTTAKSGSREDAGGGDLQGALERMREYNREAAETAYVWMRAERHALVQRAWFTEPFGESDPAAAHESVVHAQPVAHKWPWADVSPYVEKITKLAEEFGVSPVDFTDRQAVLLMNPALGGRIQVTNSIRAAISVYSPHTTAPTHIHSPNATRIVLSDKGGYTTVDGERCDATRGDIIITPNGTWHDHGNDGEDPVVWLDVLDWPLIEYLGATWIDSNFIDESGVKQEVQPTRFESGFSSRLYGAGGLRPTFVDHERGYGRGNTPMIHYKGSAIRQALDDLRNEQGDPYEGIKFELINPATGSPVTRTLAHSVQLLRQGEKTNLKRETSSSFFVAMEGSGYTEIAGQRFEWGSNDMICIPPFAWRRHVNTGTSDAVLYNTSDAALLGNIGHYRAQGRAAGEVIVELD